MNRRDFLKLTLVSVGSTAGFLLKNRDAHPNLAPSHPVSEHKWAMVIDQEKCNGCGYCVKACQASNDINPKMAWNRIISSSTAGDREVFTPVACQHCEHAPCVSVCPVGASYYRDDGLVVMDYDRCIGCRYCQVACPYGARTFNWETFTGPNPNVPQWGEPDIERRPRGVVEKCTFCVQRIDRGLAAGMVPGVDRAATPSCVNACPNDARFFGDLNDKDSPASLALAGSYAVQLKEELGTMPRVYYLPPRSILEANNHDAQK